MDVPVAGDLLRTGACRRRITGRLATHFRRVKPDSQLHAPRVRSLHKADSYPARAKYRFFPNAASEPSSRPVSMPRMSATAPCRGTGRGSRARTRDLRFWRPPVSGSRRCRNGSSRTPQRPENKRVFGAFLFGRLQRTERKRCCRTGRLFGFLRQRCGNKSPVCSRASHSPPNAFSSASAAAVAFSSSTCT